MMIDKTMNYLCILLMAVMAGCTLENPQSVGEPCDAAYILRSEGEELQPGAEDYDAFFQRHVCPPDIPYCRTLVGDSASDEVHFCSVLKENCPEKTHGYGSLCEWDSVQHCGTHDNNCLDPDKNPGWSEARCNNNKLCEVVSCMETYILRDNACKTGDQCCGRYCKNCSATPNAPICANIHGTFDCSEGCESEEMIVCNNVCVDPRSSNTFCGSEACEIRRCKEHETCVDGQCDCSAGAIRCAEGCKRRDSVETCGTCDHRCADMEGWQDGSCEDGVCLIGKCKKGYHIYDGHCEIDDLENCGGHDVECKVENAVNSCTKGACTFKCEPGYHAVTGENACTGNDLSNCGGVPCDEKKIPNGIGFECNIDECRVIACASGFHVYENSCEADDTTNCGEHDKACSISHGKPSCPTGICTVSSCNNGYHIYENGCENNTTTNCGAHDKKCTIDNGTPACTKQGVCLPSECDKGYHLYEDICEENTDSDCGEHGAACLTADIPHSTDVSCHSELPACMASLCENGFVLNTTSGSCDEIECGSGQHVYNNGCEDDSNLNCGSHGSSCESTQICSSGRCVNCGSNQHIYNNTCEDDNLSNCGTHGVKCDVANATNACESGSCTFSCNAGYHLYGNGCEANSISNCGSHGATCYTYDCTNAYISNDSGYGDYTNQGGCLDGTVSMEYTSRKNTLTNAFYDCRSRNMRLPTYHEMSAAAHNVDELGLVSGDYWVQNATVTVPTIGQCCAMPKGNCGKTNDITQVKKYYRCVLTQ